MVDGSTGQSTVQYPPSESDIMECEYKGRPEAMLLAALSLDAVFSCVLRPLHAVSRSAPGTSGLLPVVLKLLGAMSVG